MTLYKFTMIIIRGISKLEVCYQVQLCLIMQNYLFKAKIYNCVFRYLFTIFFKTSLL